MMPVYGTRSVLLCRGNLHPQCRMLGNPRRICLLGRQLLQRKGSFLDPMVGSPPPYVDFTASVSGEDVSLVDKPADVATTSAGGSAPLTAAGGQVKIEAPPRYSRKRQLGVRVWLTQMELVHEADEVLAI